MQIWVPRGVTTLGRFGGRSQAPPVAEEARRSPSEQGSIICDHCELWGQSANVLFHGAIKACGIAAGLCVKQYLLLPCENGLDLLDDVLLGEAVGLLQIILRADLAVYVFHRHIIHGGGELAGKHFAYGAE